VPGFYCWQGKEIPKTEFEIAVSADALTDAEIRCLVPGQAKSRPSNGERHARSESMDLGALFCCQSGPCAS